MSPPPPGFDPNFDMNAIGPIPRGHPAQDGILRPTPDYDQNGNFLGRLHEESDVVRVGDGPTGTGDYTENSSYLDHLPDPTQPEDTESALDQLFGEHGEMHIDPTLANPTASGESSPAPKRKATSRANMLARGGACEFCKRRKLKCTAEMPKCLACLRAGGECVYAQKKQRSRVRVLEDRLVELEKRLDNPSKTGEVDNGQGFYISPADTATTNDSDWQFYGVPPNVGFTLTGFEPPSPGEPGLMTLADAAAEDGSTPVVNGEWPWEGMSASAIASEIIKAVEGGEGLGEKIVGHL